MGRNRSGSQKTWARVFSLQLTRRVSPGNIFNFPEPKIFSFFIISTSHGYKRIINGKGCLKP